jgi:hypothetical protein
MNDEIRFIYYLKNYYRCLEDFLERDKEEFFLMKYCDSITLQDKSKFKIESEMKYVKSIINGYEQFRKS